MTEILWQSAPVFYNTGYGVQTRGFVPRILASGYNIAVVSTADGNAMQGILYQGIIHLPGGLPEGAGTRWGVIGCMNYPRMFPTKLVISLIDIWPFHRDFAMNLQQMDVKWAPITPIDHDPMQRATLEHLQKADYCLAMSPHGKRMMEQEGLDNIWYIPHGVETSIYKPIPKHKEIYNARGKFLVGCVASNIEPQDRKGWHPTLEAYGRFHAKHPDSALYLHTVASRAMQGLDLTAIAGRFGDFEIYTPDYWRYLIGEPDEMLAQHYSNMDVFLLLTRGEGFGIPIVEAQACGTPVITTDWTAPSDLVGAGWKIPIVGKRWTVLEGYWAEPSVDAAVEALEEAYDLWKSKKLDKEMKDKAVAFGKQFDFDVVHEKYMLPFLEEAIGGPAAQEEV